MKGSVKEGQTKMTVILLATDASVKNTSSTTIATWGGCIFIDGELYEYLGGELP